MIVEKVEPKPDWPAWCVGPGGKRVRFDSSQEMWPGYRREAPAASDALPSFKTGDTVLLDGRPFILKRPGRPPNESPAS